MKLMLFSLGVNTGIGMKESSISTPNQTHIGGLDE